MNFSNVLYISKWLIAQSIKTCAQKIEPRDNPWWTNAVTKQITQPNPMQNYLNIIYKCAQCCQTAIRANMSTHLNSNGDISQVVETKQTICNVSEIHSITSKSFQNSSPQRHGCRKKWSFCIEFKRWVFKDIYCPYMQYISAAPGSLDVSCVWSLSKQTTICKGRVSPTFSIEVPWGSSRQ